VAEELQRGICNLPVEGNVQGGPQASESTDSFPVKFTGKHGHALSSDLPWPRRAAQQVQGEHTHPLRLFSNRFMHRSLGSRFGRRAPPQMSSPELAPVTIWWRGWYQSISRCALVQVVCLDRPRSRLMVVSGDRRRRVRGQSNNLTFHSYVAYDVVTGPTC
jgi:hypothetical protein